jgi:TatD DNase family protein
MLIDTHCHLDFKDFDPDRDPVLERASSAGVGLIINVGSSLEGSRKSVELSKRYNFIYAAVGVHPHDATTVDITVLRELKNLASLCASGKKKVVAIGEIGLDYYRNLSPHDIQKRVFREFLALSRELNLPVILHDRDAHDDMLAILKEEFGNAQIKGVMHCFSGDIIFLKRCMDMGLHVSFTCNVTFPKADRLREAVRETPIERLLLETDAPFMAPQVYRGKRNEPAYLTFLLEELSRIKSLSRKDIERVTTHNANGLFGLGIPEETKIAYEIRDSLYLNITNRCTNECDFCVRNFTDFVKGHRLKLDKEPSAKEIIAEVKNIDKYREVVFCGYGEPTLRLDVVKEVAKDVKEKSKTVRLVTNGHGNLINKRPIAKELVGFVDKISVSLNVDTNEKYNKICKPQFGGNTFEEIKRFISECRDAGLDVEVTCLDLPQTDIERCEFIVENELGVKFRLRHHDVVG